MYTYDMLLRYAKNTKAQKEVIGYSCGYRPILSFHAGGKSGKQIIICSAIHAREHITTLLTIKLIKRYLRAKSLPADCGIYFIPMANPDGVCLCEQGIKSVESGLDKKFLLKLNGGSNDFSLWKANARGVDLNVNFDARYGRGVCNVKHAGGENYIGEYAFSEPESNALALFTAKVKAAAVICYHCKGEVIYWKFYQQNNILRDKILAEILAGVTGYRLVDECGSAGGYKDWCIQKLGIPAFTVEVGNDCFNHPFPYSQIDKIYQQNKCVPRTLIENLIN